MGVDVTHIVRNDFYNVEDRDASLRYVLDTINLLKSKLALDEDIDAFELNVDDDYNEITFCIPLYDVQFTLHNGFWQIESYYHYCQIVMLTGDKLWLREMISDIVRSLGQDEIWHAEEYYTWNGGPIEDITCPLESWLSFAKEKYGGEIPTFDYDALKAQGDVHILDYEPIYYDPLKECSNKFKTLADKLDKIGYSPVGLLDLQGFIRCRRQSDGSIHLIDMETLEPLIQGSPEAYYFDFPNTLFVVKKFGQYALFDIKKREQLTQFVSEPFRKEWSKEDNNFLIINEEAGIRSTFQ